MLSLDVRKLRRHGTLRPGIYAWGWSRDGEQYASIGIVVQPESVRLEYMRTPSGGDPRPTTCTVWLDRVACRYGGERVYFLCPDCGRRCERLFGLDRAGRFACRICLRLGYASESESPEDRTWRRQRKLESRLDDDGGKPPRMRGRTYESILVAISEQEERRDEFLAPALMRLLARLKPGGGGN